MKIAGTSSADYQNKINRDNSAEKIDRSIENISNNSQSPSFENTHKAVSLSAQKSPVVPPIKTESVNHKIEFYSQVNPGITRPDNDRSQTDAPFPDPTSHKARKAIGEYLSTQYGEERHHFKEALGIDEYA